MSNIIHKQAQSSTSIKFAAENDRIFELKFLFLTENYAFLFSIVNLVWFGPQTWYNFKTCDYINMSQKRLLNVDINLWSNVFATPPFRISHSNSGQQTQIQHSWEKGGPLFRPFFLLSHAKYRYSRTTYSGRKITETNKPGCVSGCSSTNSGQTV